MKKTIILILSICVASSAFSQMKSLDELFDKYAEKEGFNTVLISKYMFDMFAKNASSSNDPEELKQSMEGLEFIKILSVEDSVLNTQINFFDDLGKDFSFKGYNVLMSINNASEKVKMLVKEDDGKLSEFVMITGGESNTLIYIKGTINLQSISQISTAITAQQQMQKASKGEE